MHLLRAVSAAVGFFADAAAELPAQFFARAIEAGVARVAFKALRVSVPVEGIAEVEARVARRLAGGEVEAATHRFVYFQVETFARAAVVEAGADFSADAVMLAEVANGGTTVVGVQLGAIARDERLADVEIGFGNAVTVANGAEGLV